MSKPTRNIFDKNRRAINQELTVGIPFSKIIQTTLEPAYYELSYNDYNNYFRSNNVPNALLHNPLNVAGDANYSRDEEKISRYCYQLMNVNDRRLINNHFEDCYMQRYGISKYFSIINRSTLGLLAENTLFRHFCACFDEVKILGFNVHMDLLTENNKRIRFYTGPLIVDSIDVYVQGTSLEQRNNNTEFRYVVNEDMRNRIRLTHDTFQSGLYRIFDLCGYHYANVGDILSAYGRAQQEDDGVDSVTGHNMYDSDMNRFSFLYASTNLMLPLFLIFYCCNTVIERFGGVNDRNLINPDDYIPNAEMDGDGHPIIFGNDVNAQANNCAYIGAKRQHPDYTSIVDPNYGVAGGLPAANNNRDSSFNYIDMDMLKSLPSTRYQTKLPGTSLNLDMSMLGTSNTEKMITFPTRFFSNLSSFYSSKQKGRFCPILAFGLETFYNRAVRNLLMNLQQNQNIPDFPQYFNYNDLTNENQINNSYEDWFRDYNGRILQYYTGCPVFNVEVDFDDNIWQNIFRNINNHRVGNTDINIPAEYLINSSFNAVYHVFVDVICDAIKDSLLRNMGWDGTAGNLNTCNNYNLAIGLFDHICYNELVSTGVNLGYTFGESVSKLLDDFGMLFKDFADWSPNIVGPVLRNTLSAERFYIANVVVNVRKSDRYVNDLVTDLIDYVYYPDVSVHVSNNDYGNHVLNFVRNNVFISADFVDVDLLLKQIKLYYNQNPGGNIIDLAQLNRVDINGVVLNVNNINDIHNLERIVLRLQHGTLLDVVACGNRYLPRHVFEYILNYIRVTINNYYHIHCVNMNAGANANNVDILDQPISYKIGGEIVTRFKHLRGVSSFNIDRPAFLAGNFAGYLQGNQNPDNIVGSPNGGLLGDTLDELIINNDELVKIASSVGEKIIKTGFKFAIDKINEQNFIFDGNFGAIRVPIDKLLDTGVDKLTQLLGKVKEKYDESKFDPIGIILTGDNGHSTKLSSIFGEVPQSLLKSLPNYLIEEGMTHAVVLITDLCKDMKFAFKELVMGVSKDNDLSLSDNVIRFTKRVWNSFVSWNTNNLLCNKLFPWLKNTLSFDL